ncbi:hypothetical protein BO70DRAFT_371666 [Aspergillus heteromorphus CBS 117.55]|uniref:tRNA-intron lyase n=1 Tax=Aspergillus heteromorphus CBS 117.55 TaxID=1448321 RepID=A0A317W2X0_9EURO|nr:uncharacterized protein BO70DRAFT_371666 [Aspergillus heteromorphus CBS 117.55]PWY79597.1 hypothetical protein BO70DRAFT_371666 [Aspergillus heteromorphus CBS 117.55]
MAFPSQPISSPAPEAPSTPNHASPARRPRPSRPNYRHIHRFPFPVEVHPLPPLIPHNPLSLVSVLLSYLTFFIAPPHREIHSAYFDSATSSVHVTDPKAIKALWEMGFFGKGTLSRSEPSWLEREKKRRGLLGGVTSEEVTRQRRTERRELKLERARMEKLAIEERLKAEAAAREGGATPVEQSLSPTPNGVPDGTIPATEKFSLRKAREAKLLESQRSVAQDGKAHAPGPGKRSPTLEREPEEEPVLNNEEHLQLSREEAFFLVYGLGALRVLDDSRKEVISTSSLLPLFCQHSYFPPRDPSADLTPDDSFMISYVVYHHFRSLGWVVRSGVKFGVDYILYNRGPVFSHAEFAVVVIPAYEHPYWSATADRRAHCAEKQARSWWWLHCVNRVQAQVKKSLVVCYVEVPPPTSYELDTPSEEDIGAMLARYRVREMDSLDIAKLQRVALGLLAVNGPEIVQDFFHEQDAQRSSPSPVAAPDAQKSPSQPCRGLSSSRSPTRPQNAPSAIDPTPTSSKSRSRNRLAAGAAPSGKMSAESAPSDTQVISQSVLDELIKKNYDAAENAPDNNLGGQASLMTFHEGDSGHLDLLSGYEDIHTDGVNAEADDLDDDQSSSKLGESSPMVYQSNLFPESQRFLTKTPVTAVKRAHSDGLATVSPSASRNPLAADIGSSGGIMALSQVFRATQAPSSPLVHAHHPDLTSDRPSPNIPIQTHPLATTLSSPYNRLAATFPQNASAHRLNYISMQESQANRDQDFHERMTRSADHIYSDQSDEEFDKEPSFVERMRRRRLVDEEADAQLIACTAPARPASRREGQTSTATDSAVKASEGPEWTGGLVEDGGDQELGTHPVVLSEEETEQELEDDLEQPFSQSQPSSTEEDKENCHDPATTIAATSSAHDRLSQALALQSPYSSDREEIGEHRESRLRSRSIVPDEHLPATSRSSQISVVKDSQRSPGRKDRGNDDTEQWDRGGTRHPGSKMQIDPSSDVERITSSPTKQVRIRSSPPGSQRGKRFELGDANAASQPGSDAGSPCRSPTPRASAREIKSSNSTLQRPADIADRSSTRDSREKSSSMPSRVAETPVAPRSFADVIPMTSIPETSPSRLGHPGWPNELKDTADQEDDDLPPVYVDAHERGPSHPIMTDSSSPVKPSPFHQSKILSSPSGRQRRALTEIAADDSPRIGAGSFNLDINILSADDREFRSAVAMSPAPPRKKRRGNDGQSVYASDPVLPVTPRPMAHFSQHQDKEMPTITEVEPAESQTKPPSTFQRRSKPRRAESVWDMDDTPQYHVSRRERSKLLPRSRPVGRQYVENEQPELAHEVPAMHSNRAASHVPELRSDANGTGSTEIAAEDEPVTGTPRVQPPVQPPVQPQVQPTVYPAVHPVYPAAEPTAPPAVNHDNTPIAVNQVLAPWSGPKRAYYPATCFGKPFGTQQSRYLVKFEESTPIEIPTGAVKRLELRVGDGVKVDMPNVPKVTHIISGFSNKLSMEDIEQGAANGAIPMTDVYGYSAVILTPKQRKSLPSAGLAVTEAKITVPISRIYLDTILWNRLKDRGFSYDSGPVPPESRLQTPADRYSTPISPGARLSRSIRLSTGLFAGMVFAVSYGDNNSAKSRVAKMILENDGRILEDGFNELFELPVNAPVATPTKSAVSSTAAQDGYLRLTSGAADVGFACLIADRHSRRSKYMQALALNLPCLSDRWIEDCVAKRQILSWELYLLPAGESTYLNGATKSRFLAPYPATEARFSETIAGRPNLLSGQSVLLVTGRSGRTDEEKRKAYLFLTYALGASRIERVSDLKTVRAILGNQADGSTDGSGWDWVYVDEDDRLCAKAVTSGSSLAGSRKRKRSRLTESTSGNDLGLDTNVKIVGNEFLCQSLILGRLFDQ